MVVRTDEAAVSADTAPAASEAVVTPAVATPSVMTPAPERERPRPAEGNGQAACEQDAPASQTWAYLDGKCVPGRPRKARVARPPASGSAATAAPSGRDGMSAISTGPAAAAAAGTPDRRPQGSSPASPVAAVAATTQPTEQPAAAPKKAQKPPRSQSATREHDNVAGRDGRRRDEQLRGRASAAPDDRAVWHSPFERGPFNFFSR